MAARIAPKLSKFRTEEDGALIIFALFLFLLMAMMGGIAVDFMKNENIRTQLTNTLERCTLMAASLDQRLDPESVVRDCVEKAGLSGGLRNVTVLDGANSRDVKAVARVDSKPFFMHMIGIDTFDAAARAQAVQKITNVELSLVLDVSGSMEGAKLANLKAAATDFVETMIENDTGGRTAIALVPYNGQVNLGAPLRSRFTVVDAHGVNNVNCLDLPASVYDASEMSRTTQMPMTAHADTFSTTWAFNGYVNFGDGWATPYERNRWCPPSTTNIVRMPTNNVATLQNQINGLQAIGATSINAGMKWGLTLLDPASRPMFAELAGMGAMSGEFADRPFDYQDEETMKVIVLMTDGEHFAEERVNDGFRSGNSPIYRARTTGEYSIRHDSRPGPNKYYVPHLNAWQLLPYSSGWGSTQQTWPQVWANQRMSWVAWQLYARALGTDDATRSAQYTTAMNMFRSKTATGSMDTQLQEICTLAKDQDVIVFGIAFEAPANGQAQIAQCASSPQHYFNAQGLEIQTAFDSIANNLTMLKLTQ
ncbi:MAG: hypothetical protein E6Q73_07170 [Pseudorhodobacter sp.]|nr:MAG: hypothetical protein E6Q73_07170 [Pseudorhodobacter sp.]